MSEIISSNLGYPRIGEHREWKHVLEAYWNNEINEEELIEKTDKIRINHLRKQKKLGIDLIPVGDFSLYDQVLDMAVMFGIVPKRYEYNGGKVSTDIYFAIARGEDEAVASEMTKWFNTNYHYIVPELDDINPILVENKPLYFYKEAKRELGIQTKPVILGPISFLKLSKGYDKRDFRSVLQKFIPLYTQLLEELVSAGASWIQIDEPIFSSPLDGDTLAATKEVYEVFNKKVRKAKLIFQTYYERIFNYETVVNLPVAGIGIDFVHGEALEDLKTYGYPNDKVLAAGVVDGRNVWRANLSEKQGLLEAILKFVTHDQLMIQPSCSLIHVPVTKTLEKDLDKTIIDGLSFADEKLEEVAILTKGVQNGKEGIQVDIEKSISAIDSLNVTYRSDQKLIKQVEGLKEQDAMRDEAFPERLAIQAKNLKLPLLPTTSIGSLPQTKVVRQTRTKWRNNDITDGEYEQFIKENIEKWIHIQEDLDLDVLVHGEFERNDMVEYFGEKLNGFGVTQFGWVQSYGSRCVKPPLIFGNVSWEKPITTKESVYAQSLTNRPIKGMLTGPTTIFNWSFVHDDVPTYTVMSEIALALRKEINSLEESGIQIIQVDEPALREGLPLDTNKWEDYLTEAAFAFRLATASVKAATQIHTHMCYSDFKDIFQAIDALDADVISIETSRSHGELIQTFEENTYKKQIGLGVYDIHSPRIPSVDELKHNISRALRTIKKEQFWVNPDCGLKTRNEEEVCDALYAMVQATKEIREEQFKSQIE